MVQSRTCAGRRIKEVAAANRYVIFITGRLCELEPKVIDEGNHAHAGRNTGDGMWGLISNRTALSLPFPIRLLLSQWRHRERDTVGPRACAHSSLASVRRRGTDVSCGRTFCSPEHVTRHAGCRACAIGRDRLHVASGGILERRTESCTFGKGIVPAGDV